VVRHTLLGVLECAELLEKRHRQSDYQCQQIAEHCLQYCLRCGRFLAELDQMQLGALVWTVGFIGERRLAP
jgi:primosomal replication protein N